MSLLPMGSLLSGLLAFLALIASARGHSHRGADGAPAEKYWKSALPNTRMPASLSHHLHTPATAAADGGTSVNVKPSNRVIPLNSAIRGNKNYGMAATATEMQLLRGNKNYGKAATAAEMQLLRGNKNYGKAATAAEMQLLRGNKNYGKAATAAEMQLLRGNKNYGKPATAAKMQLLRGNKNYGKAATADEMQLLRGNKNYEKAAAADEDARIAFFFLEEDIQPGNKLTFHFVPTAAGEKFLPRIEADAIPFSSDKIPEILSRFSVNPESTEAAEMTATLHECEEPAAKGEKKACATSLESMVDFATSILGNSRVKAVSTIVRKEGSPKQVYAVTTVKRESASLSTEQQLVVCHAEPYAYTVFLCHLARATRAYTVSMVGKDGAAVEAVAVCHVDTTGWNPMHIAFQMLKVKPGVPICHFLLQNDVVWSRSG